MSVSPQEYIQDEYRLFVVRYMQFHNIWTVYRDFVNGHYIPSVLGYQPAEDENADWRNPAEFRFTLMFLLYSFFYSLIDEDTRGLNAFRIWRAKFPEEEAAIAALEFRIAPVRTDLKKFRHRLGFHGSRTFEHQGPGLDLFGAHSGTKMLNIMKQFKALNAALIESELAEQSSSFERITNARKALDDIAARCSSTSTANFESNELYPIGI